MGILIASRLQRRSLQLFLALWVGVISWTLATPPAAAYDNPDLLPDEPTFIIDLANSLSNAEEDRLNEHLQSFEDESGWKMRVLTQYDQTPGRAVKEYWGLDDRSVLLIADPRGGNLLNFSVGDAFFDLLPRTFWIELQTRYGNQFFVRDNGENRSIIEALGAIETCLRRDGCAVVPGLPQEQWILTLISSIVGGVISGFAAHPRKPGQVIAWQWILIFSPLWGILFFAFGVGPVVTRTSDWIPLTRNIAGFAIGFLVAYLSSGLGDSDSSPSET
ncbi:MAG: TPM domain-containing protein [Cyanobacteria bacterium P01_C01_bin.120]